MAGPKKWRPELLSKWPSSKGLRLLLCFGHMLLAIISKVSLKRTLKQFDAYGCYGAIFAFREFFQIDDAIASTTCVKAKKEALARRILQVRQLLTPPGTCLIDNATTERHVRCIAALAMKPGKCSWRSLAV